MTRRDWLSLASGCVWGGIAYLLAHGALGRLVWGGIHVSPLIGLAVGRAGGWLRPSSWLGSKLGRAFASLVGLYIAASLFGLAVGVFDALTGDTEHRIASAVVIQAVLGVLWGVTFTGYGVILWPLAYCNHRLLWRGINGKGEEAVSWPGSRNSPPGGARNRETPGTVSL